MEKDQQQEQVEEQQQGEEKMSKAQMKKLAKQQEKEQQKEAKQQNQQKQVQQEEDYSIEKYGQYDMYGSYGKNISLVLIKDINEQLKDKEIWVRGRVTNLRGKGNLAFLVIRDNMWSVQCVAVKNEVVSKQMLKFINSVTKESIIDIQAKVTLPQQEIVSCTQKVELVIQSLFILSKANASLPFQLEDASRKVDQQDEADNGGEDEEDQQEINNNEGENKQIKVGMKTRLNNRVMDLRTNAKQGIFRLQSMVCQLFREYLYKNEFIEIHTPKMLGGTSEGGSNVFRINYFKTTGCLAQSPQLYKQMCIQADFQRVFEIGPVFRAENSFTHRHLCEFTGLDMEMVIQHDYKELIVTITQMLCNIFNGLEERMSKELEIVREQFPSEPFKVCDPVPFLTFAEGIELLKENGIQWDPFEDLSTVVERQLGEIVRMKYNTDFYVLHRYPKGARPFYTQIAKDDDRYTNSYDIFMRGEEIISGAQRIHDPEFLTQRAQECGIPPKTIQGYIDSFRFGAHPHGGCGIGLERVVMLYCNLRNIRNSCLFPRDPKRITP